MSERYLVIGPNCYGFGDTLAQARKRARNEGGFRWNDKRWKEKVFSFNPEDARNVTVDEMGRIRWEGPARAVRLKSEHPGSLVAVAEALLERCRGLDDTDQLTGETFRTLLERAVKKSKGGGG